MARLFVTEFGAFAVDAGGLVHIAKTNVVIDQTPVAIGGASLQSSPFAAGSRYVRVHSDVICSIAFGANPVATVNNMRLAANQTEYFMINPGDLIAVISNV